MHDNIIVIETVTTFISDRIGCRKIEYHNQSKDREIHDWLITNKSKFEGVDRIIIPTRLGSEDGEFMGLYIGLHIRLTEQLGNIRFLPIAFTSEASKSDILSNQFDNGKFKSAFLLFTKGSFLFSLREINIFVEKAVYSLTAKELSDSVISNLNIENSTDTGHQLANEWGAFRLAKLLDYKLSADEPASLFFKFKNSFTNNILSLPTNKNLGLHKSNCKALLIDDNSSSGWAEIIQYILRSKITNPANTCSLKTISTYEEANSFNDYISYDIIFLDLRLLKTEDRKGEISDVENFSGTKVLRKIKAVNKGIQVIMLTASNKIWYIERLKAIGADGYYIKESPEYILSDKFSNDNYLDLVETIRGCLLKKPLKEIFTQSTSIINSINNMITKGIIVKGLGQNLISNIELGYRILEKASDKNDFAVSYLIVFKCIELINDYFIILNSVGKWEIDIGEVLNHYHYNSTTQRYDVNPNDFKNGTPNTFQKIAGICFQKLKLTHSEVQNLYFNIFRRNNFIHPDDGRVLSPFQVSEAALIYNYDGYLKLMNSLSVVMDKLNK